MARQRRAPGLHDERGPPRSFAGYRLALSVFDKMVLVTMDALDSTIAGGFCGLCRAVTGPQF